jgi:transposase InsO family protein
MHERQTFIQAWLTGEFSKSALCRRFGVSRPTGDKWIRRFCEEGSPGLHDRSRAPHFPANQTPQRLVEAILAAKHRFPHWGPLPIRNWLRREQPQEDWPAPSTLGEILDRHGLVQRRKKRHHMPPHSQPLQHATAPNAVWSADFKGDFAMGNGRRCYPLTISDNYSRYLIECQGQYGIQLKPVQARYEHAFRTFGLPDVIRTDNGFPFAQLSLGGLSPLSIWLLKLGILPERIEPGCPQQNPRHERMHRTLKQATANPPKGNLSAQQRAFNHFRYEYNELRTHQGLPAGHRPVDLYQPSSRPFPARLPEIVYPDDFDVRKVRYRGWVRCHGPDVYVSRQLVGEYVGLQRIDDDRYQLYYAQLSLGVIDRRVGRVIRPQQPKL